MSTATGTCPDCGSEVQVEVEGPVMGDSVDDHCTECGRLMTFALPDRPAGV